MEQDLKKKFPGLNRRHNKYGVRRKVPLDLIDSLGKHEITLSLGTGDLSEVPLAYSRAMAEIEEIFAAARRKLENSQPAKLSVEMAIALVRDCYAELTPQNMEHVHAVLDPNAYSSQTQRDNAVSEYRYNVCTDLANLQTDGFYSLQQQADRILLSSGFPDIMATIRGKRHDGTHRTLRRPHVDRDSDGYLALLKAIYDAENQLLGRILAALEGKPVPDATMLPEPPSILRTIVHDKPKQPFNGIPGSEPIALEDLLAAYFKDQRNAQKNTRKKDDINRAFAILFELKGRQTDANSLVRQDFRDLLDLYMRLPKQIGNLSRWKGKAYLKIVQEVEATEDQSFELLSRTSVNNRYMGCINMVFSWAVNEPLITANRASGVRMDEGDEEERTGRLPFDPDTLNGLFGSTGFVEPDLDKPSMYWAPLIALWHGMRCQEILQLKASDVQCDEDGYWFFDVHKRDGNTLKNRPSVRQVPIHYRLLALGFETLVKRAKGHYGGYLFNDIVPDENGRFSRRYSTKFSRYLEKHGLKQANMSFHSLRHSFRDEARMQQISQEHVCALGGWDYSGGVQQSYGQGVPMKLKHDALQNIEYAKVDFSSVTVVDWNG